MKLKPLHWLRLEFLVCLLLLACSQSANLFAQTDEIRLRPEQGQSAGRFVRGVINSETPQEVRVQIGNRVESIASDTIAEINYNGTPPAFNEAQVREKAGDFKAALDGYKRASASAGLKPLVSQYVKFRYAMALAEASETDSKLTTEAIAALQDFVKSSPNGRHTPAAFELLVGMLKSEADSAKLDLALNDLAKLPGEQGRANVLRAGVLVDQGKAAEALGLLDTSKNQIKPGSELANEAQSVRINALVAQKNFTQAEKLARELIDSANPNDSVALAPAYNALGDCLRASGKLKDALIAYLHTEILYNRAPDEHARALASITQLWRLLEKPDRAEQTLNKLVSSYPRSPWVKKAQGQP